MDLEMDAYMDLNIQEDDSENEEVPPPRQSKSSVVVSKPTTNALPPSKAQTTVKTAPSTVAGQKQKAASSVVVRRTRSNSTSDEVDDHAGTGTGTGSSKVMKPNRSSGTDMKKSGTNTATTATAVAAVPAATSRVPEKRARRFGPEDDPMQFHARPQELSRNALKRPHDEIDNDIALSGAAGSSGSGSGSRAVGSSGNAGGDETMTKKKKPKVAATSNHIFTRISFSELPLDARLATHLEKSILDGGMGLLSSTRIQRCQCAPN